MAHENKQSLILNYQHLSSVNRQLAKWLAFHPVSFIPELNAALYSIVCSSFPNYKIHNSECFARIYNLPVIDSIRALTHVHLGKLIKSNFFIILVHGVVTTRSEVYCQLLKVFYKCYKCGAYKGPYYINGNNKPSLGSCHSCQSPGPFIHEKVKSIYRNYQTLTIQ
jgi:DNA replicative helicase MCM subunit Mcm2 (Cdc46/Mcm family)